MIQPASPSQLLAEFDEALLQRLPDGAISVETVDGNLVLRASAKLQERFEELLERRKTSTLPMEEAEEYEAICHLDHALSWLNRLARQPNHG